MDSNNGGMDDAEGSSEITAQFHDTANSCRNPYGLISLWRIHQHVIKSPSLLLKGKGGWDTNRCNLYAFKAGTIFYLPCN